MIANRKTYDWVYIMKLFLMVGVVLIHSRINTLQLQPCPNTGLTAGLDITNYISSKLMAVCVPCFFILSGFLFFLGVKKFTFYQYTSKLKRRCTTLLVPYIIWCSISGGLFLIKSLCLGFEGYEIVVNGHVNWLKWLEGFWAIPGLDLHEPFAFAYWFIRNLMVFVVLSPLAYIFGKSLKVYAIFMIAFLGLVSFTEVDFHGFQWFVTGAAVAYVEKTEFLTKQISNICLIITGLLWLTLPSIPYEDIDAVYHILFIATIFSAAIFLWQISLYCVKWFNTPFLQFMIKSVFWVYSFHQLFCTVAERFWITIIVPDNFLTITITYILKFATLYGFSLMAWIIAKRTFPKFVTISTGSRNLNK